MDSRDPQTFAIIGAALEVHRQLGGGFVEHVYRLASAIEFRLRTIPFAAEPEMVVRYKEQIVGGFRPDFVCFADVVVEVKAHPSLEGPHVAQTLNYLRVSGLSRALLLNFGSQRLEFSRLVGASWAGHE